MPTYELLDGEEINRRHPDTFEIPSLEQRMNIPDNFWVKLGFVPSKEDHDRCKAATNSCVTLERMWVQVVGRESEQGTYYATLGNQPAVCSGVSIGDSIQFEAKNVLDIVSDD